MARALTTSQTIPLLLSRALYNLFLHPLCGVPGPRLWAASHIPCTLVWLSGRLPQAVHALHERHGDVVRVAPGRLSFTHPDAWREIRGHRKAGEGEHPMEPRFYATARRNILGADRADHARFRRVLAHAFSARAMHAQQPLIARYVDLLLDRLRARAAALHTGKERRESPRAIPRGCSTDLAAWFNFATFDVIGDLAFGEPFGCLAESRYHPWVGAIFAGVAQSGWVLALRWHAPWLLCALRALWPDRGFLGAHVDEQTGFAAARVERRLALGAGSRPDLVGAMAMAAAERAVEADGRPVLTRDEMVANARLLVLAGSETTATALAGAAYFLATHPAAQKRLAEEVRSSLACEQEIDLPGVSRLRYMLAVLDESMRMFPPVSSQLPRLCRPGGDVICGYSVPEGVSEVAGGLRVGQWAT